MSYPALLSVRDIRGNAVIEVELPRQNRRIFMVTFGNKVNLAVHGLLNLITSWGLNGG